MYSKICTTKPNELSKESQSRNIQNILPSNDMMVFKNTKWPTSKYMTQTAVVYF